MGLEPGEFDTRRLFSRGLKNTAVGGLVEAGIIASRAGTVRLLRPDELPEDWDPRADRRLTVWESVHHLVRVLATGGEMSAADLVARLGTDAEAARDLAYRLYAVCERKKRAPEALAYNGLVLAWPEISRLARTVRIETPSSAQTALDL